MACFHEKETFCGKRGGYTVCRAFASSGHIRCPDDRCPLFADDGQGELGSRRIGVTPSCDPYAVRRVIRAIDAFCLNAAEQTPHV